MAVSTGVTGGCDTDAGRVQTEDSRSAQQVSGKCPLSQEKLDQVCLSHLEDFEINYEREVSTHSKYITHVILFAGLNWLEDITVFIKKEGTAWDSIVGELFQEFWRFVLDIIVTNGQGLTEDDYTNKIKNILIDIENAHSPDKVSKSKLKSHVQNKLYQTFLLSIKNLNSLGDNPTYRLIAHYLLLEIHGKNFQQNLRQGFGLRKRTFESELISLGESIVEMMNKNMRCIISVMRNELDGQVSVSIFLQSCI